MNINKKYAVNRQQKHGIRFASKLMSTIAMGALGAMTFSAAHAQATDSRIFGKAPTDGATITAHSDTGFNRHGTVNSKGRYTLSELRPGTYVVSLEKDGKTLASLSGVPLFVSSASEVDFACDNDQCTASLAR
ncbi:carboxypeptidase-like regulatory domain-containing protein [Dyella psychrodurans]|uniref:Carboxypeptidase regulatory-like domain-containing protein n=1 Tax=Dyella psychrodurans TaxID=1927960 RepID=A0A370WVG8_9GAMM|nr:carboxypeptidase-like regulatory domain-containing protein [Dyella psychrodurans]RDS80007.1 carboxypeptidase regulatory-like domain-containing protein [Dyella psychrodurans]